MSARQKISLLILLYVSTPYAAKYYVDYAGGSDSNGGTAYTTPWKHCPGDTAARNNAAAYTHVSGDTIVFKGGVAYFAGSIALNYSYITYAGARTWGNGKAVIDGQNDQSVYHRYGFIGSSVDSFITIDNFLLQHMGGAVGIDSLHPTCGNNLPQGALGYSGCGIYINNPANLAASTNHDIKITNCNFYQMGWWQTFGGTTCDYGPAPSIQGLGVIVNCNNTKNILIDSCDFNRVGDVGIQFWARAGVSQNIEISHCRVHDYMRWGIVLGWPSSNAGLKDVRIHDNMVYNFTMYDAARYIDTCAEKIGAHDAVPHTDFIVLQRGGGTSGVIGGDITAPIRINNNLFYTNDTLGGGTAIIFMTAAIPGEVWLYNNVVKNDLQSYGWIATSGPVGFPVSGPVATRHHLLVANNTCYQKTGLISIGGGYMTDAAQWEMYNNINYGFGKSDWGFSYAIKDSASLPNAGKINNNLWYTGRSDSLTGWIYSPNSGYWGFNALKSLGFDLNSIFAKPQFTDTSFGLGINSSANDVHLQATSPARGAGKNLSNYFNTDKDGNPRPATGAWDIGAYEYVAGTAVAPPVYNHQASPLATIRLHKAGFSVILPSSVRSPELAIIDLAGRIVFHTALSVMSRNAGVEGTVVYTCAWRARPAAGAYFAAASGVRRGIKAELTRTKILINK